MIFKISQAVNITVTKNDEPFLFVKRKLGIKVLSQFYQNDKLIFESTLITYFLKQIIEIKLQELPHFITFERNKGWYYSITYNETILSLKVKYFKRPAFRLFENGKEIGSIGNPNLFAVEGRYYEMNTDTNNETINLYFLILFMSQLRVF